MAGFPVLNRHKAAAQCGGPGRALRTKQRVPQVRDLSCLHMGTGRATAQSKTGSEVGVDLQEEVSDGEGPGPGLGIPTATGMVTPGWRGRQGHLLQQETPGPFLLA